MSFNKILVCLSLVLSNLSLIAQDQGFLRGNITDGEFGGPMIGAAVTLADNPSRGTTSDFDGNYSLPLEPGTYKIKVSFVSYATLTYTDVVIKAGEVTILDAEMKSSVEQLQAVEVVATATRNSEAGMLMEMKNASNVVDGLSSQSFRKVGDSDLSGAIKRVTGVTVQGGKYVYVRGLGDRYTKTTLNGMSIPGLDPDVNAVQIDIFPTSVLENVAVFKTFTPDLYGDFTGGLVNVVTKNFPEQKQTQVSLGTEYIVGQTFNPDYLTYEGGNLDFLAFDDGNRELPFSKSTIIPYIQETDNAAQETYTRSFNPTLATQNGTAIPNISLSANHGNQINRESGATLGYNLVLNYKNEYNFYQDVENNSFIKDDVTANNTLIVEEESTGDMGKHSSQWSALASGAYKKGTNSISLMLLHSQLAESSATYRYSRDVFNNQNGTYEHILAFTQRSFTTLLANGKHQLGSKLKFEWGNALTRARVYDPDFRSTSYIYDLSGRSLGFAISRFWRDLNEINENARVDFTYSVNSKFNIKTGANALLKWREFETLRYTHQRRNRSEFETDPDWFLEDDNIWTPTNDEGTYTIGNEEPANNFSARQNVMGYYLMAEHPLFANFKLIYGARLEWTQMFYTGRRQGSLPEDAFDDEETMNELNILPSANIVYSLNERMNLRASASQTIARPSFKEKSYAQIYDPITKRTFIGNIDLEQTEIWNFDLRYEWFISPRELFSVAAFYKLFDGHIEMVPYNSAPDNLQPRNSGDAYVRGVEIEIRKGFKGYTNSKHLDRLFIGGNLTLVQSGVDMTSILVDNDQNQIRETEYDLRRRWAKDGETIDEERAMAGQSPYSVNANISYEIIEKKTSISLAYNVQGEKLSIVASGRNPDVYTTPFNSLDFNAYFSFGKELNSRLTIGATNILDDDRTLVYKSYGTEDRNYSTYKPGIGLKVKYAYTF